MSDFITTLFGLKDRDVEEHTEKTTSGVHHYTIKLVNRGGRCPRCGRFTKTVKEYHTKTMAHSIFLNEPAVIHYKARRFICPSCGKTFYEEDPFASQYSHVSDKTVENVLDLLKEYNHTFRSVAKAVDLSVNEVIKIFDEHVQVQPGSLSEYIALDEFYFSRHAQRKYALMILSLNKGYVIDILPDREKRHIRNYFRAIPRSERETVRFVSTDMNEVYRDIVYSCFPNAVLCIDPFHVVKNINDALNDIRLRVLRKYKDDKRSDEYYLLKYQRHLLYSDAEYDKFHEAKRSHHFRYKISDADKLDMMLDIDSDLKTAHAIKQHYMFFNDKKNSPEEQREELEIIIDKCLSSGIEEMIRIANMLENWEEEILNSFNTYEKYIYKNNKKTWATVRVTSGPIEGRNKMIKIILKLANGYQNFERFRNRALYVLNKRESYSDHKLPNTVKRIMKDPKKESKKG